MPLTLWHDFWQTVVISSVIMFIFHYSTFKVIVSIKRQRRQLYDAIWRLRCLNYVDYGEPCAKILCQICEAKTHLGTVPR